jgi:hypothetical protein
METDLLIRINRLSGLPILIRVIFFVGLFKGQTLLTDAKIDSRIESEYQERNEKIVSQKIF